MTGAAIRFFMNYAAETAKPLDASLVEAGGVKQCSKGDNGRGPSSAEPDYAAIYEVPGNREEATALVVDAAKKAGFDLVKIASPSGAPRDDFYEDRSKPSKYDVLESGSVQVIATIFSNRTYDKGNANCTLKNNVTDAPRDKTTIDFTVNMPAVKR